MKTTLINSSKDLSKRDIIRSKQLIGSAPNLTQLDEGRRYQFVSYASFECDLEKEGKEPYTNTVVTCVDPDTGEEITISTSSDTFTQELISLVEELEDELAAGEPLIFTIYAEESKNFSGKWYKPILV